MARAILTERRGLSVGHRGENDSHDPEVKERLGLS